MITSAFRRWKHARRVTYARNEIESRNLTPEFHGLNAPLVISLTSYPARFSGLEMVLKSLLRQSITADRVILWLAYEDMSSFPASLHMPGLEIRSCPNWRSYKKIIPTLMEIPDAYIVTADDDVYYGPDWLAGLVECAGANVVGYRAHQITMNGRHPRSYGEWMWNIATPQSSPLIFPTGVGGVLYAPGIFYPEVTDINKFQHLAPSSDDVWLYWMHRLEGSRPQKIGKKFRVIEWPDSQAQNLRNTNLNGRHQGLSGNDRALQAMIEEYGWPK